MYSYNANYVPCVFCHSTIPAEQMAAHLSQCQYSGATVMQNPCGTTQSVQYRRVVRVERKTVDDHNVRPVVYQNVGAVPVVYGVSLPSVPPAVQYGQTPRQVTYVQPPPQRVVSSQQRVMQSNRESVQVSAPRVVPSSVAQSGQQSMRLLPGEFACQSVGSMSQQSVQGVNCQSTQGVNYQSVGGVSQQSTQGVNQQYVQQFTRQSVQRSSQQSVRPSQPVQQSIPQTNQQNSQRSLPPPSQQSIQRPVQPKSQSSVNQNSQPFVQQRSQQPIRQQPVQRNNQHPPQKSGQQAGQPTREYVQQSVQQSNRQPVQRPVQRPVQQPVQQPLRKPTQQHVQPRSQQPTQQPPQPLPSRPTNPSQTTHPAPSQPRQSPTGTVEVLKPGSLSDRIKMFEAKTCSAPVVPMPETRTYDESAGEDTFVPCVEAPKPASIAERRAQLEKQICPNPSPPKPAIPCRQQEPSQNTPQPPKREINQSPYSQQAPAKSPGKLSIPSSIPGQLSLEEMLQKKLAQGARQPSAASSAPASQPSLPSRPLPSESAISHQESRSTYQESQSVNPSRPEQSQPIQPLPRSQLTQPSQPIRQEMESQQSSHQELESQQLQLRQQQQMQQPTHHSLTIPPPVPGQLSLEEMLQKKQSHIVTTMHEEYQESTQSTTIDYVTPQQPIHQQPSITPQQPSITPQQPPTSPPTEPSHPVITFTDRTLQDSTNECLFTANGVFLALLTKEDVKKVFASDAPLAISGTSDAIVCIYKDQTCLYHYSPESKDYQLITCLIRNQCVNTRVDRVLSMSNALYYGILIMDHTNETITSIWFKDAEERDDTFQALCSSDC